MARMLQNDREEAVLKNLPMVWYHVRRFQKNHPWIGEDELFSAGQLGLVNAANRFDPERGYKFSTYLWRPIVREMIRVVQKQSQYAARYKQHDDLEIGYAAFAELRIDPADPPGAVLERNEFARRLLKTLPRRERIVVELVFLEGATPQIIAKYLGCSPSRVRQIKQRALRRMREAGRIADCGLRIAENDHRSTENTKEMK